MSEQRDRREASKFPIPDLELPPPRRSESGMRPIRVEEPAPRRDYSTAPGATDLDFDLAAGAALDLDLDLDAHISGAAATPAFSTRGSALDFDHDAAGVESGVLAQLELDAGWPSAVTPRASDLPLDAVRIQELSGFGAAPGSLTLTPIYALRVWFRTRALRVARRAAERELRTAETSRDQLLAELAERSRPALELNPALRTLFEPLSSIDGAIQKLTSDLSAHTAEQALALEGLDRRRAELVEHFEAASRAEAEHAQVHAQLEQAFDRALARHKRCFIEIRALEQHGAAGASADQTPAARIAALRTQADTLRIELDTASRAFESSRALHDEHVRAVREAERALGEADRKRTQTAALARDARERGAAGLNEAAAQRRSVFVEIGRTALRLHDATAFDAAARSALVERDAQVLELARRVEEHRRAMHSCDLRKVRAGVALGLLAALVSIAVVLASSIY